MRQKKNDITLITSFAANRIRCPGIKGVMRRLQNLALRGRLPPGLRHAASVAEPAGRATWHAAPKIAPRTSCESVTVMTANLWHDFPRYRSQSDRLERFARLVEEYDADILLLQEVSRRPGLEADDWLANRLGMAYLYARVNGHADIGFEEGLAVFSRFPLDDAHLRHLSPGCNPFVRRLALGASVQTSCGPLLAISVHLALTQKKNWHQIQDLQNWIEQMPADTGLVVGGDFNTPEQSHQIKHIGKQWTDTFRHLHPDREAVTHELKLPWGTPMLRHRLDYIFLRPGRPSWQVLDARLLETRGGPHSDHHSMLARLVPG